MVQRTNCRHYFYRDKKSYGIDKPTPDIIRIPMCKVRKMTVGGCREDCKWFEPKP